MLSSSRLNRTISKRTKISCATITPQNHEASYSHELDAKT